MISRRKFFVTFFKTLFSFTNSLFCFSNSSSKAKSTYDQSQHAAIAYRYAHSNYKGTKTLSDKNLMNAFNDFELIKEIVKTIIIEYNEIRKIVKLSYSEYELMNGQLEHIEFK